MTSSPNLELRIGAALEFAADDVCAYLSAALGLLAEPPEATSADVLVLSGLSLGIERLLKISIAFHEMGDRPRLIREDLLKPRGHNLNRLREDVVRIVEGADSTLTESKWPHRLLIDAVADPLFAKVFSILDDFADRGRYYDLSYLSNPAIQSERPVLRLDELRVDILCGHAALPDAVSEANRRILSVVRIWIEALLRCWQWGFFGPLAKGQAAHIHAELFGSSWGN